MTTALHAPTSLPTSPHKGASLPHRLARSAVFAALESIREGTLTFAEKFGAAAAHPAADRRFGSCNLDAPDAPATTAVRDLHADVIVRDPSFYARVALDGTLGAGESYVDGHWDSPDLTAVIRLMIRNRNALRSVDGGWSSFLRPLRRLANLADRNTRAGSRRNIAAHYDLSNEFFTLWLDPTMMYSCAVFDDPSWSLLEAQNAKLDRICRALDLSPGDRLLEIGTGWGGLAIHAARHFGCRVTTTTISRRQAELARERIARAGLTDRVEVLTVDYRDLASATPGSFDRLVSIEMIEAVGSAFLDTYLGTCSSLLAPDGLALIQAITIADRDYEYALAHPDFIQRHVFPGSFIPSIGAILRSAARTDLRLTHMCEIGPHYATTLARWRDAFESRIDEVRALGFDDRFIRLWRFYLCYCEGGFAERHIGTAQLLFAKPANRSGPRRFDAGPSHHVSR